MIQTHTNSPILSCHPCAWNCLRVLTVTPLWILTWAVIKVYKNQDWTRSSHLLIYIFSIHVELTLTILNMSFNLHVWSSDGELYAGTSADFMGRDFAIFRTLGKHHPIRTEQHDSRWLNGETCKKNNNTLTRSTNDFLSI